MTTEKSLRLFCLFCLLVGAFPVSEAAYADEVGATFTVDPAETRAMIQAAVQSASFLAQPTPLAQPMRAREVDIPYRSPGATPPPPIPPRGLRRVRTFEPLPPPTAVDRKRFIVVQNRRAGRLYSDKTYTPSPQRNPSTASMVSSPAPSLKSKTSAPSLFTDDTLSSSQTSDDTIVAYHPLHPLSSTFQRSKRAREQAMEQGGSPSRLRAAPKSYSDLRQEYHSAAKERTYSLPNQAPPLFDFSDAAPVPKVPSPLYQTITVPPIQSHPQSPRQTSPKTSLKVRPVERKTWRHVPSEERVLDRPKSSPLMMKTQASKSCPDLPNAARGERPSDVRASSLLSAPAPVVPTVRDVSHRHLSFKDKFKQFFTRSKENLRSATDKKPAAEPMRGAVPPPSPTATRLLQQRSNVRHLPRAATTLPSPQKTPLDCKRCSVPDLPTITED